MQFELIYIHYDARVTLKTYLPVKRIRNKFLVLPGHHNGYIAEQNLRNDTILSEILTELISTNFFNKLLSGRHE